VKITMNVNDDLLRRVDAYAKANYLTRTGVFSFAVSQYLTSQELPTLMVSMKRAMEKIAETGSIDAEAQKVLDAFSLLVDGMNFKENL